MVAVAAGVWAVAACGGAPGAAPASPDALATLPPSSPPTLLPATEVAPPPPPVAGGSFEGGDNASFQGVTIAWPAGVATGASVKSEPAMTDGPNAAPPATTFVLDGYTDEAAGFPATIRVFALDQGGPDWSDAVAALRTIVADRPDLPKVPMPATPASRILLAQVRYLDGRDYRGVRFVTQLAQDVQPVNNASLVYAFEGLTDDGTRWIQARLPLDALSDAVLPSANVADYAAFVERFDAYIEATTRAVDGLAPDDFAPMLGELDALVGGVRFR